MQIGLTEEKLPIELTDEARKTNLAVFGIKNTGKAFTFIPSLLDHDLKIKDRGITIVVDTPELAWYLYGMCRIAGRKVDILKPSVNFSVTNELLFKGEWNYEDIKTIYDFEESIKSRKVTIIDMEEEKFGEKAVRAVSMLLLNLQSAMVKDRSKNNDYAVYLDGAASYLQYIKNLLKYGDYYGFTTTLFFKSREELGENKMVVDNYVRNIILLQGISYEDAKYFGERMNLCPTLQESVQKLLNRAYGEIVYEILEDKTFKRKVGEGFIVEFDEKTKNEFATKGAQCKRRFKEVKGAKEDYQLENESEALKTGNSTTLLENLEKHVEEDVDIEAINPNNSLLEEFSLDNEIDAETLDNDINEDDLNPSFEKNDDLANLPKSNNSSQTEIKKKEKFKVEMKPQEENSNKEPQLNKKIKTSNYVREESKPENYSLLDEFDDPVKEFEEGIEFNPTKTDFDSFDLDLDVDIEDIGPEPEFDENLPDILEDLPIVEETVDVFDLSVPDDSQEQESFVIGGKNNPYRKINNKQIERSLEDFVIK